MSWLLATSSRPFSSLTGLSCLYSSPRKCWCFFRSGHYVPSTQCKIKCPLLLGHFLLSLVFAARVDTCMGWLTSLQLGLCCDELNNSTFSHCLSQFHYWKRTLFPSVNLSTQECGGPWFSSAFGLPHLPGKNIHVRADNLKRTKMEETHSVKRM